MGKIRVAIAGVGNYASSLLQGIEYYKHSRSNETAGLVHPKIGGYEIGDLQPVAAFDIDRRKVGQPLERPCSRRTALPSSSRSFRPTA